MGNEGGEGGQSGGRGGEGKSIIRRETKSKMIHFTFLSVLHVGKSIRKAKIASVDAYSLASSAGVILERNAR